MKAHVKTVSRKGDANTWRRWRSCNTTLRLPLVRRLLSIGRGRGKAGKAAVERLRGKAAVMAHFERHWAEVFGDRWPQLRASLKAPTDQVAWANPFLLAAASDSLLADVEKSSLTLVSARGSHTTGAIRLRNEGTLRRNLAV